MQYGNPAKPNQHERDASEGIHKIVRYLSDRYRTSPIFASVALDPSTYYNDRGFPSRFLSLRYPDKKTEIRICLQRNVGASHAWYLGLTTYLHDNPTDEIELDFHTLPNVLRYLRDSHLGEEI